MSKRKRIVASTTVRVFATDDDRIGKVAKQLFYEEQQIFNQQRREAKVKSWDKLVKLVQEQLSIHQQNEVLFS